MLASFPSAAFNNDSRFDVSIKESDLFYHSCLERVMSVTSIHPDSECKDFNETTAHVATPQLRTTSGQNLDGARKHFVCGMKQNFNKLTLLLRAQCCLIFPVVSRSLLAAQDRPCEASTEAWTSTSPGRSSSSTTRRFSLGQHTHRSHVSTKTTSSATQHNMLPHTTYTVVKCNAHVCCLSLEQVNTLLTDNSYEIMSCSLFV